jgi:hypothetical protein
VQATELFKRAEAFASALEVVTRRLSESMSRGEPGEAGLGEVQQPNKGQPAVDRDWGHDRRG